MADFVLEESAFDICAAFPERELVSDAARATELITPLKAREGVKVTHVKLSNKSYQTAAAEVVAAAVCGLASVVSVDVSDVIAGRPEAEALEVLRILSSAFESVADGLTHVDISDNALGQKGIDALLPLLRSELLSSLRVCNNGMSADAALQLATLVAPGERTRLETLHYFNNMSGDGGATALALIAARSPQLVDFRFSGTRAGRAGSLAIMHALAPALLKTLVRLDLADNNFGTEGGALLASGLRCDAPLALTKLDLRDCSLGDAGFAPVLAALASRPGALQHLDFSGNDLSANATDAAGWVALLRAQPQLAHLGLEENELAGGGARALAKALLSAAPTALVSMQLCSNEIASKGALALGRAICAACPVLVSLTLNGNALSDEALATLTGLLANAGKADALGLMDDNDEDLAEDDEDDEQDDDDALAGLTDAAAALEIAR